MANKFKGFSLVKKATFEGAEFKIDKDTLYFVRAEENLNDGFLYFNGKKYGTAEDAKAALITRYGDIKVGEKAATIPEYVAEQLKAVNEAATGLTTRVGNLETTVGGETDGVKTGLVKSVSDNAIAIAKLNGEAEVEGSVAKAVAEAKTELIGAEETADTIKHAEKLAKDAQRAADAKVASVSGESAISIDNTTATAPKVTLKINETDSKGNVVLSQDADGLKASVDLSAFGVKGVAADDKVLAVAKETGLLSSTISFSVDEKKEGIADRFLRLTGIDGADLGKVNIAEFVKDGMLDSASLVTATTNTPINDKQSGEFIKLTWNTDAGKDAMYIDVTSLVDTYTSADNLNGLVLNDHAFSLNYTVVAKKADLDTVSGRTKENTDAIAKLNGEAEVEGSVAKTVADAVSQAKTDLLGTASSTGNTIGKVETAVNDLKTQIAESAVTLKIDDPYLAVGQTGSTYEISTKIQNVAGAGAEKMGLAEASDVKQYVDSKVSENIVGATGETGNNALITATAGKNGVSVASTEKLKSAVAAAEIAVQSVNSKTGTSVTLEDADIAISAAISDKAKGTKVNEVLADIYSKIGLVKVSSTKKTITVDESGRIVDVNTESVANAQAAGHVALEHGDDGALYGVMYYSGDDVE